LLEFQYNNNFLFISRLGKKYFKNLAFFHLIQICNKNEGIAFNIALHTGDVPYKTKNKAVSSYIFLKMTFVAKKIYTMETIYYF